MVRVEELGSSVESSIVERYERQLAETGHELHPGVGVQLRQLVVTDEAHVDERRVHRQVVEVGKYVPCVDVHSRHTRTVQNLR